MVLGRNNKNRKTRLQKLQEQIYQRGWKHKSVDGVRSQYHARENEVAHEWERKESASRRAEAATAEAGSTLNLMWKILVGSVVFFFVALGIAAYFFLSGGNIVSSENVDIDVRGPVGVAGGDELSLQVSITNNNTTALEFSDLLIEYPQGAQNPEDLSQELPRFRKSLGVINPGETVNTIVRSVLFGEAGTKKDIGITLEYRVEGSGAIFVKEAEYTVGISSSPIALSVDTLKEVNANQRMEVKAHVVSNAEEVIKDVAVRIDYPFGFEPQTADPEPSVGAHVWELGDIKPDESRTITVSGTMRAQDEEEKIFSVYVGTQDAQDSRKIATVYSSSFSEVLVRRPFFGVSVSLDGAQSREPVIASNTRVNGVLTWANNTSSKIADGIIRMTLQGSTLDEFEVQASNGFYDSTTNTITWNKTQEDELAEIAPGESGRLQFNFKTLPLFSEEASDARNPVLSLVVDAQGRRVSEEGAMEDIRSVLERVVKVYSDFSLSARAVHFTGPFENTGPMPPRVEQKTDYTVIWTVTNSSNDVVDGKVEARLPGYMLWVGAVDPANAALTFNPNTRTITWNIGDVQAGTGSVFSPEEVAFQVALVPSTSQLSTTPVILDDITIVGEDTFTNTIIKRTHSRLTTRLVTDPQYQGDQGQVKE